MAQPRYQDKFLRDLETGLDRVSAQVGADPALLKRAFRDGMPNQIQYIQEHEHDLKPLDDADWRKIANEFRDRVNEGRTQQQAATNAVSTITHRFSAHRFKPVNVRSATRHAQHGHKKYAYHVGKEYDGLNTQQRRVKGAQVKNAHNKLEEGKAPQTFGDAAHVSHLAARNALSTTREGASNAHRLVKETLTHHTKWLKGFGGGEPRGQMNFTQSIAAIVGATTPTSLRLINEYASMALKKLGKNGDYLNLLNWWDGFNNTENPREATRRDFQTWVDATPWPQYIKLPFPVVLQPQLSGGRKLGRKRPRRSFRYDPRDDPERILHAVDMTAPEFNIPQLHSPPASPPASLRSGAGSSLYSVHAQPFIQALSHRSRDDEKASEVPTRVTRPVGVFGPLDHGLFNAMSDLSVGSGSESAKDGSRMGKGKLGFQDLDTSKQFAGLVYGRNVRADSLGSFAPSGSTTEVAESDDIFGHQGANIRPLSPGAATALQRRTQRELDAAPMVPDAGPSGVWGVRLDADVHSLLSALSVARPRRRVGRGTGRGTGRQQEIAELRRMRERVIANLERHDRMEQKARGSRRTRNARAQLNLLRTVPLITPPVHPTGLRTIRPRTPRRRAPQTAKRVGRSALMTPGPAKRKVLKITKKKNSVIFEGEYERNRVDSAIETYGLTKCSGRKYSSSSSLSEAIKAKLEKKGKATAS